MKKEWNDEEYPDEILINGEYELSFEIGAIFSEGPKIFRILCKNPENTWTRKELVKSILQLLESIYKEEVTPLIKQIFLIKDLAFVLKKKKKHLLLMKTETSSDAEEKFSDEEKHSDFRKNCQCFRSKKF